MSAPRSTSGGVDDETMQLRRVDVEMADYLESLGATESGRPLTPPRPPGPGEAEEPEPQGRRRTDASLLRTVAAIASLAAGAIHIAATPPHWGEWLMAGLFFAGTAAFQIVWGLVALRFGNLFIRVVGLLANLGFLGVWALSRAQGMPFGPAAGVPEAVGVADLLAAALEIAVVAGLSLSLLPREREGRVAAAGYWAAVVVAFLAFGAAGAQGSVSALEHSHSHGEEGGHGGGDGHDHDHGDEEMGTDEPTGETPSDSQAPSDADDEESPAEEHDHTHAPGEEHD
ncbi:hypothetical protein [Glycomyces salinus]|uniref:hypothetical protein n=1 Tax=Glycomyces salinus TaxID=980294 RepID=UPI0018EB00FF|nr:hypothetical protein [Glycomyces salinus]